jgi:hypothetical protein
VSLGPDTSFHSAALSPKRPVVEHPGVGDFGWICRLITSGRAGGSARSPLTPSDSVRRQAGLDTRSESKAISAPGSVYRLRLRELPDGRGIAYSSKGNLWVQPIGGKPPSQLTHFTDGRPNRFRRGLHFEILRAADHVRCITLAP